MQAEPNTAELIGRMTGQGLVLLLIVLGIVKCARIARRETTSGKCVLSLMLVLLAWLLSVIHTMLSSYNLEHIGLSVLLIGSALMLILAAFVMAIIGLVDYGHHPNFKQGRAQAIWALVLSAIVFFGVVAGVVVALTQEKSRPAMKKAAPTPLEERVETFENFNFTFHMPGSPWASINADKANPDALFVIMRTKPQIFFLIVAERSGVNAGLDSELLAEVSKGNLKSGIPGTEIQTEKKYVERGFEVVEFRSQGKLGAQELAYVHHVIMHNGFAYQLVTWSATEDRDAAEKTAGLFLGRFDIYDRDFVLFSDDVAPVEHHVSEHFGYSLDLPEGQWYSGPNLTADFQQADFGAQLDDQTGVLVTALRSHGSTFDIDAVTAGLLVVHEIGLSDAELEILSTVDENGETSRRMRYVSSDRDNPWSMLCEVHVVDRRAFLVSVWTMRTDSPEELAQPVLDGFQVLQNPGDDASPLPDPVHQADMLNQLGLHQYRNRQYAEATVAFEAAAVRDTEKPVYAANVLDAFAKLGDSSSALEFIERASPETRAAPDVRSWKAWHLMQLDRDNEALSEYESLFSGDYFVEEDIGFYADMLAKQERWDEADALLARFMERNTTAALGVKKAEHLAARGEHEEAIEALLTIQEDFPLDADVCFALVESYNALERYNDTLDLCLLMENEGKGSPDVTYLIGQAQYRLRWYREAKASFEACLETWPTDEDVKSYLSRISMLLGEGDNSSIKTPIDPVPMPEEILRTLPDFDSPPPIDGYGAWYLSKVTCINFRKDNQYKKTSYLRVKIEDRTGVSQFSTVQVDFNPSFESVYVNHLKVMDVDGNVLSAGDPSDYYVVHEDNGMASNDRSLQMPVPNLAPGHVVDLVVTTLDKGMPEELPFFDWSLSSSQPVALSAVYFNGDEEQIVYDQSRTSAPKVLKSGLLWEHVNPPIYEWAPEAPSVEAWLPMLFFSQAGATWNGVGAAYLRRIEEQLVLDPKVHALAESLVEGLETKEAKIIALANHVQKEITYKAIEFGRRATIPNPARLVIENRYGDCKDHSVLLHSLLRSSGIDSQLVLVNTGRNIQQRFPSLDQFNHMIVCVPGESGCQFIDTTDKGYDLRGVPIGLGGETGLLLGAGHCSLVELPDYPNDSSVLTVKRLVSMLSGRKVRVQEHVSITGIFASFLRDTLRQYSEVDRKDWAQRMIDSWVGSASLLSFEANNIFVSDKALEITLKWEADDLYSHVDDRLLLRTPAIWEQMYLDAQPSPDRKPPFEIRFPLVLRSEVHISALEDYEFDQDLRPIARTAPYAAWAVEQQQSRKGVDLEFRCRLKSGEFPADQYDVYRTLMDESIREVGPELQLRRK